MLFDGLRPDLVKPSLTPNLVRLQRRGAVLARQRTVKDWYTTAEVAEIVGKAEFTIREHCRLGRLRGEKLACGRGKHQAWVISHEELTRYRNEGLLPIRRG